MVRELHHCRNCGFTCPVRKTSVDLRSMGGGWFCTKKCYKQHEKEVRKSDDLNRKTEEFFAKYGNSK